MSMPSCITNVVTSGQLHGNLAIVVDPIENFIKVVGCGLWSSSYVATHICEFEAVLVRARQHSKPSRTLVDLREAAVQLAEVAAMLHSAMRRMYRPPERAAIVVASNLAKLQMRRGFDPRTHSVFTSYGAAQAWLSAPHTDF